MLLVLLAIAIVCIVHADTVARMVGMWDEEHHTQSYLVPPIFLFLLWSARRELAAAPSGSGWLGVALAVALTLAWVVAEAVALQIGVFVSVVLLVSALSLAFIGWPAYRVIWFPLAFWLASVPAGSEFIPQLMNFTADISESLLKLTGVPFYRHGKLFELPNGRFEVAEVCAGLRYISAAVTLALLYCYFTFRSPWRWLTFVAVTVVVFIFANGLRATVTMWVSSETSWRDFTGPGHVWFGRALFLLAILGLFWLGQHFSDLPPRRTGPADGNPASTTDTSRTVVSWLSAIAALAVVVFGPMVYGSRAPAGHDSSAALAMPAVDGCSGPGDWPAEWAPSFSRPDVVAKVGYDCNGIAVGAYLATYLTQEQGKELVSEGNRILPPGTAQIAESSATSFDALQGGSVRVNALDFSSAGNAGVSWSWYSIGSTAEHSGLRLKLREAFDAVLMRSSPASVYVVVAFGPDRPAAELRPALQQVSQALWAARVE